MANTHNVEIDAFGALKSFRDAYDDDAVVVVLEAIANALDVKATKVDITLGNRHISFRDNGPGMSRRDFHKSYHNISHSTKTKGSSIGFAGVGAKIYLAIWKQTVIHTETYGPDGRFASDMHVSRGKLIWDEQPVTAISSHGTLYSVKLREQDFKALEDDIDCMVRGAFNQALLRGLTVTINGERLKPWNPPHEFRTAGVAKAKTVKFPVTLTVTKEDIPKAYRHTQYHVWGKTVTTKKLDWANEISEPYRNRVHVWVDAEKCSKHLKLNKGSFKSGQRPVIDMYRAVDKWVAEKLREHGYVKRETGQVQSSPKLSKFFRNLFLQDEYRWLDPNTTTGAGPGGGTGTGRGGEIPSSQPGESDPGERVDGDRDEGNKRDNKRDNKRSRRGGSGISITFVDEDDDPRDGWLDPETNNFVCNRRHKLYRKYEKNPDARNQRVKTILFIELIRHGAKKEPKDVSEALDAHSMLMTLAKDLEVA